MWILAGREIYNMDHISSIFVSSGKTYIVINGSEVPISGSGGMEDIVDFLTEANELVEV